MQVTSDFECGNGKNIRELEPGHFSVETVGQGASYASYFYIRIDNNEASPKVCRLDVVHDRSIEFSDDDVQTFPKHHAPLWVRRSGRPWEKTFEYRRENLTYRFEVSVPANSVAEVSALVPLPYTQVVREMSGRLAVPGISTFHSIGTTSRGRDLAMLSVGTNPRRRILVIAGLHGIEFPGIWAAKGMMEFLISSDNRARKIREAFTVDVLPYGNPDGTSLGLQRTNADGIDLHRQADPNDSPVATEVQAVWRWIESCPPMMYINLHGWSACEKGTEPFEAGLRPSIEYYRKRDTQDLVAILDQSLIRNANPISRYDHIAEFGTTYSAEDKNLLNLLAGRYGTIAYCYEPNMRTGADGCMEKGVKVLTSLVMPLLDGGHLK